MHNFFKSVKIGLKNRKNSHFGKYRHNFNTDFKIRGEGLFLVYQVEILVLFIKNRPSSRIQDRHTIIMIFFVFLEN
jgi:hypothetical protein